MSEEILKISNLNELTTPEDEDLLVTVDNNEPDIAKKTKKITRSNWLGTMPADLLAAQGDILGLEKPHFAFVSRVGDFSVSNDSAVQVPWNLDLGVEPSAMHSTTTNSHQLIAQRDGWYRVTLNAMLQGGVGGGFRWFKILSNGGYQIAVSEKQLQASGSNFFSISGIVHLTKYDYVYVHVYQNSGYSKDIDRLNPGHPGFSLEFLRE